MIYIPNAVTSDSQILFVVINNGWVTHRSLDLYPHPHPHKTCTCAATAGLLSSRSSCHCRPVILLVIVIPRPVYTLRAAVVGGAGCSPMVVALEALLPMLPVSTPRAGARSGSWGCCGGGGGGGDGSGRVVPHVVVD
jgi:hypothetical protein